MTANPRFQRLTLLTGAEAAAALEKSRVIVVGLGGVGSWAAEALVRSGIGKITLVDFDRVHVSNINRQAQALDSTAGRLKTEALEARLKDINPLCEIQSFPEIFSKESAARFDIPGADYVIDAIDTLACKLDLIEAAAGAGKKLFSSMGMARKLDPTQLRTADIWKTSGCPLARLVREGLRKRNFSGHFTAVYSGERLPSRAGAPESGVAPDDTDDPENDLAHNETGEKGGGSKKMGLFDNQPGYRTRSINGSAVTVTAAAGMILASLVIRDVYAPYAPEALCATRETAL